MTRSILASLALALAACGDNLPAGECDLPDAAPPAPGDPPAACVAHACGVVCGIDCGTCTAGRVCSAAGQCVQP